MTINELIQVAHSQAKAKGFWDKERNTDELLMLIVSECGEALEAHRKGRVARLERYDTMRLEAGYSVEDNEIDTGNFVLYIKDTFEDELADIVIRIADLAGGMDLKLRGSIIDQNGTTGNVGDDLLTVTECVVMFGIDKRTKGAWNASWLESAIGFVSGIASDHNIDLGRHIELKLAYNMTRPALHGKRY